MNIPLAKPSVGAPEIRAVEKVLLSGFLVQGEQVGLFEKTVEQFLGGGCCAVAVSSGTAALHLCLKELGVSRGDCVILPAYSWIATANVVELCGAKPVFVDIDPHSLNMDVHLLRAEVQNICDKKEVNLKCIIPVHAFGNMADMEGINTVADEFNVPVVEDAACALGATHNQMNAGLSGTFGCFSFHPRKIITTGEGGIVVTKDEKRSQQIKTLRNHGLDASGSGDFVEAGFNYRMTDFQGALGVEQMKRLQGMIEVRQASAACYDELLSEQSWCTVTKSLSRDSHVRQSYILLLENSLAAKRAEIIRHLRDQSIEINIGTIHMPLTRYYREKYGYKEGDYPVTDSIAKRAVSLPLYDGMTKEEQGRVVGALYEFIKTCA